MSLQRILQPIKNKIFLMIARGLVSAVDNTGFTQRMSISVLQNENMTKVERLESYGFSSVPRRGAEVVILYPNGERKKGFVIQAHHREYRPYDGLDGDAIMYNYEDAVTNDSRIHIKTGKIHDHKCNVQNTTTTVSINNITKSYNINASLLTNIITLVFKVVSATVELGITGTTQNLVDQRFLTLFNGHTHSGVALGAFNTGTPTVLAGPTHMTTNTKAS